MLRFSEILFSNRNILIFKKNSTSVFLFVIPDGYYIMGKKQSEATLYAW